jgi:hypothetical protein
MATIRDAISAYRPETVLEKPITPEAATAFLAEKSGVDAETVGKVMGAMGELAFWHLVRGQPIPIPGVGTLKPTVGFDGKFGAVLETDPELSKRMSEPEAYRAGVKRKENVGASLERLAQMWNSGHPNDPVTDHNAYAMGPAAR